MFYFYLISIFIVVYILFLFYLYLIYKRFNLYREKRRHIMSSKQGSIPLYDLTSYIVYVRATTNWEDFRLTSESRSSFPVEASR